MKLKISTHPTGTHTFRELFEQQPEGVWVGCESGEAVVVNQGRLTIFSHVVVPREHLDVHRVTAREWSEQYRKLAPGEKLTLEITA